MNSIRRPLSLLTYRPYRPPQRGELMTEMTMKQMIRALRAEGWRVRNCGWPDTLAAEARWDFCRTRDVIFPMTPAAGEALKRVIRTG